MLSLFYLWESIQTIKFYSLEERRVLAPQIELMSLDDAKSLRILCIVILSSLLILYRYRSKRPIPILIIMIQVILVFYYFLF
jgi:uncharacterized membrane protein (UPF0136 family)